MKIINLLPKSEQRQMRLETMTGQVLSFWVWVIVSMGFLFALTLVGTIFLNQRISINNTAIEDRKQTLKSSATQQLEQEVSSLNKQIALIDSLRKEKNYWSKALVELSYLVDSNTTITSIRFDAVSGTVEVFGNADDRDGILAFWAAVKKSKYFKDINFPLTNLDEDSDADFTFIFSVNKDALKEVQS